MTQETAFVQLNGETLIMFWGQMGAEIVGIVFHLVPAKKSSRAK